MRQTSINSQYKLYEMATPKPVPSPQVHTEVLSQSDPRFRVKPFQQMAAACTGAVMTSLIMTPLDVVKIRLQAQQMALLSKQCFIFCNGLMDHVCPCLGGDQWYRRPSPFTGTLDAIIKISRNEGITSLWSGLSPTLVLAIPSTVVYFTTYEQLRTRLNDRYKDPVTNKQPIWVPMLSGLTARFSAATCVSPMELVRTKMQSQRLSYLDVHYVIKGLVKLHGYKGLWKGLTATLCRDVPFSGIYWVCYEYLKSYFYPEENVTFWFSFLAGSASGTIAAFITTPFDVVKTHQQIDIAAQIYKDEEMQKKPKKSMFYWFRRMYAENGVRGLYTGLTPRVAKIAPACAIMVSTFEYGKNFFEVYNMNRYKRQHEAEF
ncbi:solute carrier family 25 member 40-like [Homalodisca vitripennis]|uniref:solute carrier family 25 member 40-like n=1 Tax=Homalodisca vitripennis TaxID=197043 RepID=UPI001EE9D5C4|nr:solute carrier family 25 member 40-like [Homalodisca vitripennis]XP_046684224.1 solute carrier family 25 member 40-like [Homalodisca vitripennis]